MKFTSKKLVIILLYVLLVDALYLTSATFTKYTSTKTGIATFNIGQKLYFNYERGELFRNNNLIIGVEVENPIYNESGELVDIERRIETMNVTPGDNLTYHFYVSNYNLTTLERNGLDGSFYVSAISEFSMPAQKANYRLSCTLSYREIPEEGEPTSFKTFTTDKELDLPVYIENDPTTHMKYEFEIYVILDDQIQSTSADDYIDATLSILLFIDATNDVVVA